MKVSKEMSQSQQQQRDGGVLSKWMRSWWGAGGDDDDDDATASAAVAMVNPSASHQQQHQAAGLVDRLHKNAEELRAIYEVQESEYEKMKRRLQMEAKVRKNAVKQRAFQQMVNACTLQGRLVAATAISMRAAEDHIREVHNYAAVKRTTTIMQRMADDLGRKGEERREATSDNVARIGNALESLKELESACELSSSLDVMDQVYAYGDGANDGRGGGGTVEEVEDESAFVESNRRMLVDLGIIDDVVVVVEAAPKRSTSAEEVKREFPAVPTHVPRAPPLLPPEDAKEPESM